MVYRTATDYRIKIFNRIYDTGQGTNQTILQDNICHSDNQGEVYDAGASQVVQYICIALLQLIRDGKIVQTNEYGGGVIYKAIIYDGHP